MERVKGIEPSYAAWEAAVLPLNYTRIAWEEGDYRTLISNAIKAFVGAQENVALEIKVR